MKITFKNSMPLVLGMLLIILSSSFSNYNNNKYSRRHAFNLMQTTPKVFKVKDSLVYGLFVLRIESTCLRESVFYGQKRLFNPVILKQRLIFLKKGKILNVVLNRSKNIYQKINNGRKILMLSNVYASAWVVKGKYKTAFAIEGYGGCNSCQEKLDFFSLDGKPAYKTDSAEEWKLFLKRYGISDYNKSTIKVIAYPPNSGASIKGS